MKIVAIVPARINSKRLPGKVLKKFGRYTILEIIIKKLKTIKKIKSIVVATSKNKSDKEIFNFCKKKKIKVFRGSLSNVAQRFYKAGAREKGDGLLRINGDSPLIDIKLVNKCIKVFQSNDFDLVTNIFPRSFPVGQSVEIIKKNILKKKMKLFKNKHKEHITKYFYENSKFFSIYNVKNTKNLARVNLAVDTLSDFTKIKKIFQSLGNPIHSNKIKYLKQ